MRIMLRSHHSSLRYESISGRKLATLYHCRTSHSTTDSSVAIGLGHGPAPERNALGDARPRADGRILFHLVTRQTIAVGTRQMTLRTLFRIRGRSQFAGENSGLAHELGATANTDNRALIAREQDA